MGADDQQGMAAGMRTNSKIQGKLGKVGGAVAQKAAAVDKGMEACLQSIRATCKPSSRKQQG